MWAAVFIIWSDYIANMPMAQISLSILRIMNSKGIVKALIERTAKDLHIDYDKLSQSSHQKIYVKCTRCDEEFLRERRHVHQLHSCPTHITRKDGVKLKWCMKCKKFILYEKFQKNDQSNDGLSSICLTCTDESGIQKVQKKIQKKIKKILKAAAHVRMEYRLIHPHAKVPFRKRTTDAGYDLYAIDDVEIPANGFANIPTGIQIAPPIGYYYVVEGRSSMWKSGIMTHHGVIDGCYNGEVFVGLYNLNDTPYYVKNGDRIAQIILHKVYHMDFAEVEEFSDNYNIRGLDGWGASGR